MHGLSKHFAVAVPKELPEDVPEAIRTGVGAQRVRAA
jgi:hypothetical protein